MVIIRVWTIPLFVCFYMKPRRQVSPPKWTEWSQDLNQQSWFLSAFWIPSVLCRARHLDSATICVQKCSLHFFHNLGQIYSCILINILCNCVHLLVSSVRNLTLTSSDKKGICWKGKRYKNQRKNWNTRM